MKRWIFCIIALCIIIICITYSHLRDDVSVGDEVVISQALQESGSPAVDSEASVGKIGDVELFRLPEETKLPAGTGDTAETKPVPDAGSTVEPEPTSAAEAEPSPAALAASDDTASGYEPIISDEKVQLYNDTGTAVIGDTGYEIYNYVPSAADAYAKTLNDAAKRLGDAYNIYALIVPTSVGITLPDNKVDKVNSSDQKEALKKLHKKIKAPIRKMDLYDTMMQHRTEYIYFRTDHHWTDLGAYYTYQKFCMESGRTPHALSEYKKDSFGSFIGTYYGDSNNNKNLRTDKVKAYYPVSRKLSMKYQTESGSMVKGEVIDDASSYGISAKYLAFLCGDNSYTTITNPQIQDDSACIVVKESYGNAFVPYLADHYHNIYVLDYRYWTGRLTKLAEEKKVQDILFVNNISMTRNAYLIGKLSQIVH